RLEAAPPTADPVADLVASGAAYVRTALDDPALYRAMFDIRREHRQPVAAAMTFAVLVGGGERAVAPGRPGRRPQAGAAPPRAGGEARGRGHAPPPRPPPAPAPGGPPAAVARAPGGGGGGRPPRAPGRGRGGGGRRPLAGWGPRSPRPPAVPAATSHGLA